ncbi:MAG: threonine/serine dehydratase, partial [Bryobacteraceae bacterium]
PSARRGHGVVAFSSGNHAQAVAIAASHLGMKATLVMPDDVPPSKLAATKANGADVIIYDRLKEDREAIGRRISAETGATLVPPFDHEWIIAGQGTAAIELLDDVPDLDALLLPVGGGGFLAGSCIAAKAIRPAIRMFGVEPELANDTYLSIRKGERVQIPPPTTIADGLRSPQPGVLTFPIIQQFAEEILLVGERDIRYAVDFVESRLKLVVEPSGAVPAAAVLARKLPPGLQRIGILISGGNV